MAELQEKISISVFFISVGIITCYLLVFAEMQLSWHEVNVQADLLQVWLG